MPCDYSKYPLNWKSEIRPSILERDGHKCSKCKVPNKIWICRGKWGEDICYQNDDGQIYSAEDGTYLGSAYVGDVWVNGKQILTKVVLTVAHLDNDVTNNDYSNLAALCQRCHLHLDKEQHMANSRATRERKRKLLKLF
jgi:5-methylcytosine-specific restriction endonuclease McrA